MEQAISNFLDNKLAAARLENEANQHGDVCFSDVTLGHHHDVTSQVAKRKLRTREKIEKLCNDGAKNYPDYLKLVHTGDSDFSDDETITERLKKRESESETKEEEGAPGEAEEKAVKKEGTRIIESKLKRLGLNRKQSLDLKKRSLDLRIEDAAVSSPGGGSGRSSTPSSGGGEKLGLTPEKEKSWSTPNTPYGFRSWYGKYL